MEASAACLHLIRISEGLSLTPYQDAASNWTVGYGHKLDDLGPIAPVTFQEAERLLMADVALVEREVNRLVAALSLTQGQFDALVDFAFNLGAKTLEESTLLRKLEAGDIVGAASEFPRWSHVRAGGKIIELTGLLKRRMAERSMFLCGMPLIGT